MYAYTYGYSDEEVYMSKGQVIGGAAIGIIAVGDSWLPRLSGDVGNATTFNFPVHYKVLEGCPLDRLVSSEADPLILERLIEAAKELEKQGCRAISTTCGYFANYLPQVATALNIPAFLSSLMQIPIIKRALKPSQKVGIICANGRVLSSAPALKNCGVDDLSTIVIAGTEDTCGMKNIFQCTGHLNPGKFEKELVDIAKQMVSRNPDIGAIVLECANLPSYAWAIQRAVRLPVFDFTTLINWAYNAVVRRPFDGFI